MHSPWASPNDPRIYETPFGPMAHADGDFTEADFAEIERHREANVDYFGTEYGERAPLDAEPQPDITATRNSELMVTELQGNTPEGEEFIDRYLAPEMHVVDAGRIILPDARVPAFANQAHIEGLTIEGGTS